jgi:hypothetical protein
MASVQATSSSIHASLGIELDFPNDRGGHSILTESSFKPAQICLHENVA